MSKPREVRIAVIGTGVWAQKIHYPTLALLRANPPGGCSVVLHGVCSLDAAAARAVAEQYGFARVYRDLDELIADRLVDAVAMVVMPQGLPGVVQRVQVKGVPILTEKPPGANSQQAAELAKTVTVPHVVAFNRRFVPLTQRLREEVQQLQGTCFVEGRFYRHGRLDPDFIRGTGIHLINTMEYVFGPVARAHTLRLRHPQEATWNWLTDVEFASGVAGRMHFLPCTGMQTEQIEVHSAARSLHLEIPTIGSPDDGKLQSFATRAPAAPAPAGGELPPCGSVGGYQALFNPTDVETVTDPAESAPLWRCGFAPAYEELISLTAGGRSRSTFAGSVATMQLAEAIENGSNYVAATMPPTPTSHAR